MKGAGGPAAAARSGTFAASRWRCVLLLLTLLACARGAAAATVVLDGHEPRVSLAGEVQVLVDGGRSLALPDAQRAFAAGRFAPAQPGRTGELNFGYTRAAVWIRTDLRRAPQAPAAWRLALAFPSLDRIDVFLVAPDGQVSHQVSGDLLPFSARPLPHRDHVFPLELAAGKDYALYVRVVSEGSLTVPLTLWTPAALSANDHYGYAGDALYFGTLLALLLYNLLIWLSLGEGVFLRYVAFVASIAVGFAGQNGFGAQFLWPDSPAWGNDAFPVGMAAAGFFACMFTRSFLGTRQSVPKLDRMVVAALLAFALSALAPWLFGYHAAAILTSLSAIFFAPITVWCGLACMLRGHPGARYFLLAWLFLLVGVMVMALRNFGWLPTTWLTTHIMQIGSMVEMLLLSFALADRINVMRREREEARKAVMAALRESGQRLEARVAERTAELEQANLRLRENEQALQHLAFHDPLTGLVNRVMLDDRLRHAIGRAEREGGSLAVLVIDLDGFKRVNDQHGHAVGDEVLIAAARRMRDALRASDTFARLGGDEFVAVVEAPAGADEAEAVARKLGAALERPVIGGGREHRVGASIGVALYPGDGATVESLIRAADRAMYQVKSAGRGGWLRAAPSPAP